MRSLFSPRQRVAAPPSLPLDVVACPLCESDRHDPVMAAPDVLHGIPGTYTIVRCRDCRHAFTNPRPTLAALVDCYPDDYGCHADVPSEPPAAAEPPPPSRAVRMLRGVPGLPRLYRWLADKRSEVLPPPPVLGARAIELGCGRGDFLVRLQQAGWQPVGVDLVPRSVELGRSRGLDVRLGTLADLTSDGEAAAVFGWMVLEHTPDPAAVLADAARLLGPGGFLALSVPDFAAWDRRLFGRWWRGLELPRHLQHFTPATLRRALGEAGFEQVVVVHQRSAFNLVSSVGLWLRARQRTQSLGQRLLNFCDAPSMLGELALAPLAKLLGAFGQSGRLTVTAQRATTSPHQPSGMPTRTETRAAS